MEADEDSPVASLEGLGTKVGKAKVVLSTTLLLVVVLSGSGIVVLNTMGGWQTPLLETNSVRKHPLPLLRGPASNCSIGEAVWLVEMQTGLSLMDLVIAVVFGTLWG